jgi:predicted nucleic acid-binding protein
LKAFLDTSVLIATFYDDHEHHQPSLDLFLRFPKSEVSCSGHSLLEVYSSLTGMPGKRRASPDEAMLFLKQVREQFTIVTLRENDYAELLQSSAAAQVAGGAIYDGQLVQCALKVKAEVLYTWNVRDFRRIAPASLDIRQPSELGL